MRKLIGISGIFAADGKRPLWIGNWGAKQKWHGQSGFPYRNALKKPGLR